MYNKLSFTRSDFHHLLRGCTKANAASISQSESKSPASERLPNTYLALGTHFNSLVVGKVPVMTTADMQIRTRSLHRTVEAGAFDTS